MTLSNLRVVALSGNLTGLEDKLTLLLGRYSLNLLEIDQDLLEVLGYLLVLQFFLYHDRHIFFPFVSTKDGGRLGEHNEKKRKERKVKKGSLVVFVG